MVAYDGAPVVLTMDPWRKSAKKTPSVVALTDQQWHMLTVSTQPYGVKGYR